MEKNHESNKVVSDTLTVLSIMAELHAPLNFFHYNLPKGLCILMEDLDCADDLLFALNRIEDVEIVQTPRITKSDLLNYNLVVHKLKKNDTTDVLDDFLATPKFLSAVIASAMIPDNLPDTYKIVFPACLISHNDIESIDFEVYEIKNFLRDEPGIMEKELDEFNTSLDYINNTISPLRIQMTLAARMYRLWHRSCHYESETQERYFNLLKNIDQIIEMSKTYLDNVDLSDVFVKVFLDYTDKYTEVCFINTNDANDKSCADMIKNGNIIFYDEKFYYIAEKLFKKICEPLLNSFHITYIKENLRISGILCCNNSQSTNYTRKKILFTESGINSRNRFLWLEKKYFAAWDRLLPEERGKTNENCVPGKSRPERLPDIK